MRLWSTRDSQSVLVEWASRWRNYWNVVVTRWKLKSSCRFAEVLLSMNRFINQGHELLAQAGGLSGKGNKHATQGHMPLRFYEL